MWADVRGSNSVGVNRDIAVRSIGRKDVVVEIADFVLRTQGGGRSVAVGIADHRNRFGDFR